MVRLEASVHPLDLGMAQLVPSTSGHGAVWLGTSSSGLGQLGPNLAELGLTQIHLSGLGAGLDVLGQAWASLASLER